MKKELCVARGDGVWNKDKRDTRLNCTRFSVNENVFGTGERRTKNTKIRVEIRSQPCHRNSSTSSHRRSE